MPYNKEFEDLNFSELIDVCEARGIPVVRKDDAEALRKKLGKKSD